MVKDERRVAASEIRRQVEELEAQLKASLEDRRHADAAVEDSQKKTCQLQTRALEIAMREGNLRKQVADLRCALKCLED